MAAQPVEPALDMLESILRRCAEAAPQPWYPKIYAQTTGTPRDSLDLPLEKLRLAGLIRLTDWVQGSGQGYVLTPEGKQYVESPRLLARLRNGELPTAPAGPPPPPPLQAGTRLYQQREQLREELQEAGPPLITRALLIANVLVFLAGYGLAVRQGLPAGFYLRGGIHDPQQASEEDIKNQPVYNRILRDTGSVAPVDLVAGQWWRLLTSCFVHGGLLHLGVNMYALFMLGRIVEQMWGRWRFLFIYLTSGLGGSCLAMAANPLGPPVVGASGALCGMLASVAVWIFLNRKLLSSEFIAAWKRNLIINSLLIVGISFLPGVSKEGHFGGAIAGLIAAALLNWQRFAQGALRWLALAGALAVPVICLGSVVYAQKTSEGWKKLKNTYRQRQELQEFQAQQLKVDTEERDMQRLLSRADEVRKAILPAQNKAADLLDQNPEGRPEKERKPALEALVRAREQLDELAKALEEAAPYRTPHVEEKRQLLIEYVKARSELCTFMESLLNERKHLAGEEKKAHDRLRKQILELQERIRKAPE